MVADSGSSHSGSRVAQIVAHRANVNGSSLIENKVKAITAAARAGADAVELDVRRTRDGELVLSHDAVVWFRLGRIRVPVAVIKWSRRRWVRSLADLDEALRSAFELGLDVKLDVKDAAAVPAVRRLCQDRGLDRDRLALWCRSPDQVADRANHDVFGEVALLAQRQEAAAYLRDAVQVGATAVSLNPGLLGAATVSAAHQEGLGVYAWIVEDGRHREAVELGVDGLVTDWIAQAKRSRV
jgi:glycerophosphoryl diester phosphodiesterase